VQAGSSKAVVAAPMRCRSVAPVDSWLRAERSDLIVPLSLHVGTAVEATFVCMSSRPIAVERRRLEPATVVAAWAAYARSGPAKERSDTQGLVLYTRRSEDGAAVMLAENRARWYIWVEVSFISSALRYSRGAATTADWLAPGCGQILQVAVPDEASGGRAGWRCSHRMRMSPASPFGAPWHEPEISGRGEGFAERAWLHDAFAL